MRKILSVVALLSSLVMANSANALVLDCKNAANRPISVAVAYLDYDGKTWMVEGWYNFESGTHAKIELDSANDIFYIYGEFEGDQRVSGGPGSLDLPVYYRTFKYTHGQAKMKADETVSFVRGVATDGVAEITFGPLP